MRLTCVVEDSVGRHAELQAEDGLSFLIESRGQRLLLDTGQSDEVLTHNLHALDLWSRPVHHVVLSHAHNDHIGGMSTVLEHWPEATVHAHSRIMEPRYSRRLRTRSIGLTPELAAMARAGAWQLTTETVEVIPGVFTTGTVARRPYPTGSSPRHSVERNGVRLLDDYADDLSLVLEVQGGVALMCGCCHAGLRNTMLRLREMTAEPLVAVIGGLHLLEADDNEIAEVSALLDREGVHALYVCHCTGERAIRAFKAAFGDAVHACSAGTIIEFDDRIPG